VKYIDIQEAIGAKGLRLILVQGMPSPWGVAAKAMMEHKGLDYIVAPQVPGGENAEILAWSGTNSGPVVAWDGDLPINRWDDILLLLERLNPDKPLVPEAADQRAQVFGLSHEICGELGLGWTRRLDMFRPAMEMAETPEAMENMSKKWRYNAHDVALANQRTVATL
jgi:glutathione S-transferase